MYILTEQKDRIGYLYLNRIDKKNALNSDLVAELKRQLIKWSDDDSIRAVVLGSKSDVFSAGADLEALQRMQGYSYEENLADSKHLKELFELILCYPKLLVSRVQGHAIAGGCGLATVCDFCFATPESKFGYTEVKIGFVPALVSIFLVRKVGESRAKDLLLTGELVSAEQMQRYGLVSRLYPAENIETEVHQWLVQTIRSTSVQSIAATKSLINAQWPLSLNDALELAAATNAKARGSEDCKRGVESFLAKEKIEW